MTPKQFASSVRGRQAAKSAKHMPDSRFDFSGIPESAIRAPSVSEGAKRKINFSDIPESTDAELKRAQRVGRPRTGRAKQLIAIRIAPRLLAQLRRLAAKQDKPYQTLIHELLEKAARKKVAYGK